MTLDKTKATGDQPVALTSTKDETNKSIVHQQVGENKSIAVGNERKLVTNPTPKIHEDTKNQTMDYLLEGEEYQDFKFIKLVGATAKEIKKPQGVNWKVSTTDVEGIKKHIAEGGNHGVFTGDNGLVIPDFDSPPLYALALEIFPKTYASKSKKGGHLYYKNNEIKKTIHIDRDGVRVLDILAGNSYVCGAGCTWYYEKENITFTSVIKNNSEIAQITAQEISNCLAEMGISWQLKKDKGKEEVGVNLLHDEQQYEKGDVVKVLKIWVEKRGGNIPWLSEMEKKGGTKWDVPHPVHGAATGVNFSIETEKNLWFCFHHGVGGGLLSLIAVLEGIIRCEEAGKGGLRGEGFKEAQRLAQEAYGVKPKTPTLDSQPLPLKRKLPDPEPYPIKSLGGLLGEAAFAMAKTIKAPEAICGQSVLAAATLAVQSFANISIDGRIIPIIEFFLTIGKTGDRKSAVDTVALKPHYEYQSFLAEQYKVEYSEWANKNASYEAAKKEALSRKNKEYNSKKTALDLLGPPPEPPIQPIYITEEPTYEGFVKLLEYGQPSAGLFSDEGGRFICGYGMSNDQLLKTSAGISNMWDGKAINRVRASANPMLLMGKRVSLHLMAQPEVAQILLSNPLLQGQGLLSRCLVTWPTSIAGQRTYSEDNLSTNKDYINYQNKLIAILRTPKPLKADTQNELMPRELTIAPDSKKLWISFYEAVEKENGEKGKFYSIQGFGNKAAEHVLRIAGVLTLIKDLDSQNIKIGEIKCAIELVTHYLNEALRLSNHGNTNQDLINAEKLWQWLVGKQKKVISLVEVYQYGINSIRDAATARKIMGILTEHGYALPLSKEADGVEFEGKLRKEAWELKL